jgi:hypothetical protein
LAITEVGRQNQIITTFLHDDRIGNLDKLYLAVSTALDNLLEAVGLEAA